MSEGGRTEPVDGFSVGVGDRFFSLSPNGRVWEVTGESRRGWILEALGGPRPGQRSDGRALARPRRIWRGTRELSNPKKWQRGF